LAFPKKFPWLLEHLLPCNDKVAGCEISFPDSVVFLNGKPKFVAKTDKDGFMTGIKNA
jgi:hypothetical protein